MANVSTDKELRQWSLLLADSVHLSLPYGAKAIGNCLVLLEQFMTVIPPEPDRNRAKTFNGWVRGVGRFPKSYFVPVAGGGYKLKRKKRIGLQRKSERSAQRWRLRVKSYKDHVEGVLENTASYSGWLFSTKDKSVTPHQASWHTATGWPSVDEAFLTLGPQFDAAIDKQLTQFLTDLSNSGERFKGG